MDIKSLKHSILYSSIICTTKIHFFLDVSVTIHKRFKLYLINVCNACIIYILYNTYLINVTYNIL